MNDLRADAKQHARDLVARYRKAHPEATGSDRAVLACAELEILAGHAKNMEA